MLDTIAVGYNMIQSFDCIRIDLGRKDSNLRITGPKPVALPLGHAPFIFIFNTRLINTNIILVIMVYSSIMDSIQFKTNFIMLKHLIKLFKILN